MKPALNLFTLIFTLMACIDPTPADDADGGPGNDLSREQILERLNSKEWPRRSAALLLLRDGQYEDLRAEIFRLLKTDPHPAVRDTAALALADLNETGAAPIIAAHLGKKNLAEPEFLMDAFARLGDGSRARVLLPYLESDRAEVRLKAVESLSTLEAQELGPDVLRMARRSKDASKTRTYITLLGRLEVKAAEDFLLSIGRRLKGPDLTALYMALGRLRSRRAVPFLVEGVGSSFVPGRKNAVQALIEIDVPEASGRCLPLLSHGDREVRFAAAKVVVQVRNRDAGPAALALLQKREARSIGPAAYVLGGLRYAPARAGIEDILSDTKTPDRELLARALGMIGDRKSVPLLIATARESAGEGRYGAVWSLGLLRSREALPVLLEAAHSSDLRLASLAIKALGGVGDPAALEAMRRLGVREPDLRLFALDSIAAIPGPESRKILEEFAGGEDSATARRARLALSRRKDS